jgi:multidrug efflux pump subunit AcrA (membrane-fusion protein)
MNRRTRQTELLENEPALLPADPPARVARWTAWLLLGLFAAAIAFAGLVRLPEVVSATFVLEPEEGADPIQAPIAAEVAAVRVREGQEVKAGEELFRLRSDEILAWQARLSQLKHDQQTLQDRVRKLDEAHTAQLAIKDAEIVQAEREVAFRQKYFETSKDLLRRAKTLAEDKLLSQVELMREELATAQAEKDLVLGEKSKQQTLLQRQELDTARARARIDEVAEAEKLKLLIATLERQLENCTGDVKFIRAPYDAVVLSLRQRNAGGVVVIGAQLCQLARAGARPLPRLTLPEAGMSRLRPGQPVRLRHEAYPYQRYGSVPATLVWISPAAVEGPSGTTFIATCRIEPVPQAALVKPKVGMRGEARILTGRRTLFERVLEPLRVLRERMTAG